MKGRGESGMGKSNHVILLELKEFEFQSFHELLTWKKEEEDNNVFYAQSTGKKSFNDSTNAETGNSLGMYELLSSAIL